MPLRLGVSLHLSAARRLPQRSRTVIGHAAMVITLRTSFGNIEMRQELERDFGVRTPDGYREYRQV